LKVPIIEVAEEEVELMAQAFDSRPSPTRRDSRRL
jgi:hypothetical protein